MRPCHGDLHEHPVALAEGVPHLCTHIGEGCEEVLDRFAVRDDALRTFGLLRGVLDDGLRMQFIKPFPVPRIDSLLNLVDDL